MTKSTETYNNMLNLIEVNFSDTHFGVNLNGAQEIVSKVNFADLPNLQECARKSKPNNSELLAIGKCTTSAELNAMREMMNKRFVASGVVPHMIEAELAARNKPIAKKRG